MEQGRIRYIHCPPMPKSVEKVLNILHELTLKYEQGLFLDLSSQKIDDQLTDSNPPDCSPDLDLTP